jgi:hypothetical protein
MSGNDANRIGEVGELLLTLSLCQKTREGYLFEPLLIGGKWPTIDVYTELAGERGTFCFFQVKTTTRGFHRNGGLRVKVDVRDLNRLCAFHAPTYLVGIALNQDNLHQSKAYIAAVRGQYSEGLQYLSPRYELNEENLILLRNEVLAFWQHTNITTIKKQYGSNFDI